MHAVHYANLSIQRFGCSQRLCVTRLAPLANVPFGLARLMVASTESSPTRTKELTSFDLIMASARGDLAAVQRLVETEGANVNCVDYDSRTPLHLAAGEGRLAIVMYLLASGANSNAEDRWGGRPLDDATHRNHDETAKNLRAAGAEPGSKGSHVTSADLIDAASKGDLETVQRLVEKEGVPFDEGDYDQRTALHLAAGEGRLVVVAYLLVAGAKVNPRDRWAGTPLDDALRHNHDEIAKALRAAGGQVGGRESSKCTTTDLIEAASKGDLPQVIKLCEREGLEINGSDYDSRSALHLAAGEGRLAVVAYLLASGADPNAADRWGGQPLDDALRHGHLEVARAIRSAGGLEGGLEGGPASATRFSSPSAFSRSSGKRVSQTEGDAFLLDNLSVPWSEVALGSEIGRGAFGVVHKGTWRGMRVACKMIDHKACDDDAKELSRRLLLEERRLLIHLRHPNICMLLGWAATDEHDVIISELMQRNLEDLLRSHVPPDFANPRGRPAFSRQTAIIHRDLKPANLLLDFSGVLKISDFGLARVRPDVDPADRSHSGTEGEDAASPAPESKAQEMTAEAGSYRYMAPEVFRHEKYNERCDVYSFAMIGHYVLHFQPPFAFCGGVSCARAAALDGARPTTSAGVEPALAALLRESWHGAHAKRPPFTSILEQLERHHDATYGCTVDESIAARASQSDSRKTLVGKRKGGMAKSASAVCVVC